MTLVRADHQIERAGRVRELYRRHAPDAARLAYLLTGDRALAEDIVHEAFVRLYGRFQDLRNPDAFPSYMRRTVTNIVYSHFRHLKVEREHLRNQGQGSTAPSHPGASDVEARRDMWLLLQQLPERQRAALVLRFYEDLTEAQIAEVLSCPVGTVKSLVSRGLERLRGELSTQR
jgi:RNA polymerase sigma-70 factor (sigma-E family)